MNRVTQLEKELSSSKVPMEEPNVMKQATKVRSSMCQDTVYWTSAMKSKLTQSLYRRRKCEIARENISDNSLGSHLLAMRRLEESRRLTTGNAHSQR